MVRNGKAELTDLKILKKVFQERIEYVYILTALLIMGALSYGLYCNMPSDWQYDPKLPENRLTIIALALTLLVMSLLVCYHARYRLSIQPMNHRHSYERTLMSTNSQVQLLTSDLPPSYESICRQEVDLPPPYSIVISPVAIFTLRGYSLYRAHSNGKHKKH